MLCWPMFAVDRTGGRAHVQSRMLRDWVRLSTTCWTPLRARCQPQYIAVGVPCQYLGAFASATIPVCGQRAQPRADVFGNFRVREGVLRRGIWFMANPWPTRLKTTLGSSPWSAEFWASDCCISSTRSTSVLQSISKTYTASHLAHRFLNLES